MELVFFFVDYSLSNEGSTAVFWAPNGVVIANRNPNWTLMKTSPPPTR